MREPSDPHDLVACRDAAVRTESLRDPCLKVAEHLHRDRLIEAPVVVVAFAPIAKNTPPPEEQGDMKTGRFYCRKPDWWDRYTDAELEAMQRREELLSLFLQVQLMNPAGL